MWYWFELEEILDVLVVDEGFNVRIVALTRAYVVVEGRVGESQVVLIGFATESVGRSLLNEVDGQSQLFPYCDDFLHGESTQWCEVARCVTISRGISHPVFREVASVGCSLPCPQSPVAQLLQP